MPVNQFIPTQAPGLGQTPTGAGLGAYGQAISNMFAPQMMRSQIVGNQLGPISMLMANPMVMSNPQLENQLTNSVRQLMASGQIPGGIAGSQTGTTGGQPPVPGSSNISGPQLSQHIIAQQAGLTHPGVGHTASAQASALSQLLPMLTPLENAASQYGGAEGGVGSFFGTSGAKKYNAMINTAKNLAQQGGLDPSFLDRAWSASSVGGKSGSIEGMRQNIQNLLNKKKNIAQESASGQLVTGGSPQPKQQPSATQNKSDSYSGPIENAPMDVFSRVPALDPGATDQHIHNNFVYYKIGKNYYKLPLGK